MVSDNGWKSFWDNAFKPHGPGDQSTILFLVLVAGLVMVAAGIALHTYYKGRGNQDSPRRAGSQNLGMVWMLPVVAVILAVVLPALYCFNWQKMPQPNGGGDDANLGDSTELITTVETSTERPTWVDATYADDDGERKLVVVHGSRFAEVSKAKQDALQAAAKVVREDFEQTQNVHGDWQLPNTLVMSHAVKDTYVERIQNTTGRFDYEVHRAHYLVELSPQVREAVFPSWRTQVVDGRIWILGSLLGFVTLLLGTTASYLRFDTLTGGNYRGRLKVASLSLIAAGGLGLSLLLRTA